MKPYGVIEACKYEDLASNTPVFNVYALDDVIWVHLPPYLRFFTLTKLQDITGRHIKDIEFDAETIVPDKFHPWLKIDKSILDLEPGQHVYKLELVNEKLHLEYTVFMSYITRTNNPKTPYIYMPNRGNPEDPYSEVFDYEGEYITDD